MPAPRKIDDATLAKIRQLWVGGMSQLKLAKKFGVSQSHLSRIFAGERRGPRV